MLAVDDTVPMMHDSLLANLRSLLRALPDETNSISPSIYDTAMVLRLAPPKSTGPAFEWLLEAQAPDGGWGDQDADERARTVPTLAVVLLLAARQERQSSRQALTDGVAWLRRTGPIWAGPVPADVPVGVELLLPSLLDDAHHQGIAFPQAPYQELRALGAARRARIARIPTRCLSGSTAAHSWEGFGTVADPSLVHPISGVGGSPAATAAWVRRGQPGAAREAAQSYLLRAELATNTGVPGVMPTVFPVADFMRTYGLHTLAQTGLLAHPAIADEIRSIMDEAAGRMTPDGIGFAAGFMPDADDTAAMLGALLAAGRTADLAPLRRYTNGDHFATYEGELQPSLITTARAVQVYSAAGQDVTRFRAWIARRQHSDGLWVSDKWNAFWGYTTWQAVLALRDDPAYGDTLGRVTAAILARQHREGGWGVEHSTPEATAYAVLALAALPEGRHADPVRAALARGRAWLFLSYQSFGRSQERHWLGKERYSPLRLSRLLVLAAMISTEHLCPNDPWR